MTSRNNPLKVQIGGRLVVGDELKEYAKRKGLCQICAQYQTHKKVGFFGNKWEPLTTRDPNDGTITVYKGHCIQPTCYQSVNQVKELLGEKRDPYRPSALSKRRLMTTTTATTTSPANNSNNDDEFKNGYSFDTKSTTPFYDDRSSSIPGFDEIRTSHINNNNNNNSDKSSSMDNRGSNNSGGGGGGGSSDDRTPVWNNHCTIIRRHGDRLEHSPPRLHYGETDLPDDVVSRAVTPPPPPTPPTPRTIQPELSTTVVLQYHHQQHHQQQQHVVEENNSLYHRQKSGGDSSTSTTNNNNSNRNSNSTHRTTTTAVEDRREFRASGRVSTNAANTGLHLSLDANNVNGSFTGIQRLECLAKDGSFVDFFVRLELDGNTADVVSQAFIVLQEQLMIHQATRPDGIVLSGGGWVKTIDDKITEFKFDRSVVVEGLRTLLTICRQPYNYRITIVKKGAVEVILSQMDEYSNDKEITEISCKIFDCLSRNPKDKLNANHTKAVAFVRKMVDVMCNNNNGRQTTTTTTLEAKKAALSTLCNLSKQKSKNESIGKKLLHTIREIVGQSSDEFANACADILLLLDDDPSADDDNDNMVSEELAGSITSLIWKVSCGNDENRDDGPNLATEKLVSALVESIHRYDSRMVVEATCGAFANITLKSGFSILQTESVLLAVCEAVRKPSGFGEVRLALCAVHAICNLLSDEARRDAAMGTSYPICCRLLLDLIGQFPNSTELLEHGCSAVAHLSFMDAQNKERIVGRAENEFDIALRSFRNMAADRENAPPELLESVLGAILAWSDCPSGVRQIVRSRTLESINVLVQVEADPNILEVLEMISANCEYRPPTRAALTYEETLLERPELFANLMQDVRSNPSATISLIRTLRESGALERGVLDHQAFEALIPAMSSFRNSEDIQAEVLLLLSEAIQRGVDQWLAICRNSVAPLTDALCRHGDNSTIAYHGCYVLRFVLRHCDLRQLSLARSKLAGALVSIMGGRDGANAASASVDVYTECLRHDPYFLEIGNQPNTIRTVVGSMNMHLESADLQRSGCNFLRALCNDQSAKEIVGREGGVLAVMTSMMVHGRSKMVCEVALSAIRRLSMVPTNKLLIKQNGGIDAILENVRPQMGDPVIVSSLFSALNNIAVESESRSVAEVGFGVIIILNDSMSRFPDDEQVQKNACFLLKSCSYRSSNLRLMHQYNRTLIPLLTRAAQIFPEQCRVSATGVVNRLRAYS